MKTQPGRPFLLVLAIPVACLVCLDAAEQAWAIKPHPHDQGKIEYPNPLPANFAPHSGGANDTNHSHVGDVDVREVTPSAFGGDGPHMVDDAAAASQAWRTYASWDNRTFRNGDSAAIDAYGHGYIEPGAGTTPRYKFDQGGLTNDQLGAVKDRITSVWQAWQTAAKGEGEDTRTTPDGTALLTDLPFRETGNGDGGAAELDIVFSDRNDGNFGLFEPGMVKLSFDEVVKVKVFVDSPDWEISIGDGAFAAETPEITLPWNFEAGAPAALTQDIDYKCVAALGCGAGIMMNDELEGDEPAFLGLGLKIDDTAGSPGPASVLAGDMPLFEADFLSVAIHEWGHVIGLDHVDPLGSVMHAASPFTLGLTRRAIDTGSAIGAAVLYSIPVPEPAASLLLAVTLLAPQRRRRR